MHLPRADRWGQPDFEGYLSLSDLTDDDDEENNEDSGKEEEFNAQQFVEANIPVFRRIATADLPPPPPEAPAIPAEEEEILEEPPIVNSAGRQNVKVECAVTELETSSQCQSCGDSKELRAFSKDTMNSSMLFQRMLLEISAEYNRVVAQLQNVEEILAEHGSTGHCRQISKQSQSSHMSGACGARHSKDDHEEETPPNLARVTTRTQFAELHLEEQHGPRHSPFEMHGANDPNPKPEDQEQDLTAEFMVGKARAREMCQKLCTMRTFDGISSMAIICNAALFGWVANDTAMSAFDGASPTSHLLLDVISMGFTAWFVLELLLRIWVDGVKKYFCNEEDRAWNLFDVSLVMIDVSLTIMENVNVSQESAHTQHLMIIRVFRVLRVFRAVRFVRVFRFFRELRMMVSSILRSGSSLFWSLVLLGLTIYTFAIYFLHVVADHVLAMSSEQQQKDESYILLTDMFGNLLKAEYTLYMVISGGISWGEVNALLLDIHVVHGAIFAFFTFFTTFALLNIITGIFVETSINSARSTREEVAQDQMNLEMGFVEEMKKIFQHADQDKSGTVTLSEFEEVLARKEVSAYLDALGIEIDEAKSLFNLLDLDGSGEIAIEEFTFGCMRLKGGAKSIDLATLMTHSKRMADHLEHFFTWTESQFKQLHNFEARVEEKLTFYHAPMLGIQRDE